MCQPAPLSLELTLSPNTNDFINTYIDFTVSTWIACTKWKLVFATEVLQVFEFLFQRVCINLPVFCKEVLFMVMEQQQKGMKWKAREKFKECNDISLESSYKQVLYSCLSMLRGWIFTSWFIFSIAVIESSSAMQLTTLIFIYPNIKILSYKKNHSRFVPQFPNVIQTALFK